MYCRNRYRQAWIWEDKTIDYISKKMSLARGNRRPKCGSAMAIPFLVGHVLCGLLIPYFRKYLCQKLDTNHYQFEQLMPLSASKLTLPSLVTANFTTNRHIATQWRKVSCSSGHVTHVFLACDAVTFCGAENGVTVSFQSASWALPTSLSCPALRGMTLIPPSFSCQSKKQYVPYSLVCDHRRDCLDGTDESFCDFRPCLWSSQFQCLNRQVCYLWDHDISVVNMSSLSHMFPFFCSIIHSGC